MKTFGIPLAIAPIGPGNPADQEAFTVKVRWKNPNTDFWETGVVECTLCGFPKPKQAHTAAGEAVQKAFHDNGVELCDIISVILQ